MIYYHPESESLFVAPAHDHSGELIDVDPSEVRAGTRLGGSGSIVRPSLDFETYSEAGYLLDRPNQKVIGIGPSKKGGLPAVGTPAYAEHPSTEILCLAYDLKDGAGRQIFIPGMTPQPVALLDYVARGGELEAFNYTFEFWIWNMVGRRLYNWPALSIEQGVCIMARSRRYSLPGSLNNAAKVLGVEEKQADGGALLRKLSRPHKPTKKRDAWRVLRHHEPDAYARLYSYNLQDVKTEDLVAAHIPEFTDYERATWITDQTINARGVRVDVESLHKCIELYEHSEKLLTAELVQVTNGAVTSVGEVKAIREYVGRQGLDLPKLDSDTVTETLDKMERARAIMAGEIHTSNEQENADAPRLAFFASGPVGKVLQIRASLAGANIKKLFTLRRQLNSDGRLRDQYMYCGADRTGRWSSGGAQLQNLTAKGPKTRQCNECDRRFGADATVQDMPGSCPSCGSTDTVVLKEWEIDSVIACLDDIRELSKRAETFAACWGNPVTAITGCLRGLFIAAEGKRFICCDYTAIEAVVAACLSRCQWRIEVFSTHGKIYEQSAANATGISFEEILQYKKDNGMHHPARKGVGKIRELAGGYGGWIGAWKNFGAEDYFPNDAAIKEDILNWRAESPEIVEMWGGQFVHVGPGKWDYAPGLYGLEGRAIEAIQNPGRECWHIDIMYVYDTYHDVLKCRLPSGRFLNYHRPRLHSDRDKLNRGPCVKITFEGWNGNSQKGPIGWMRLETYGGRLFENVVQAVSADIQAEALVRLERNNYPIVMHTHDEAIAELEYGRGSIDEMAAIMSQRPTWAHWWPIKAAGWEHERYQKD